ncbi:hypothetical protein JCM9279_004345 [Rhodotorula babjevae]
MSFVLPNPPASDHARRDYYHPAGPASSTAAAPIASTSAAPMPSSAIGLEGSRRTASSGRPATRRKGKGKGRTMMIKIFYSLNSPRLGPPSPSSTTPQLLPASTPTPDFLAVLDPALAPSPNPPAQDSSPATNYSCMARLSAPVWVQVVGGRRGADGEDAAQFGRITLKTCLSAICISRPELVIDPTKDFSVSAIDPYESSHQRQAPGSSTSGTATASRPGEGLVEGKGMLSWSLAEKKEGTTMVCGKIVGPSGGEARRRKRRRFDDGNAPVEQEDEDEDSDGDEPEETLEIWLQLTERDAFTQGQFLDALRSYHHNPVQHLQNEISDFNPSPPNRYEAAVFPPAASAPRPSTSSTGDPIKRKRPRESPVLPLPSAPPSTSSLAAPFATGPAESSPASFPAPPPALDSAFETASPDLHDPSNAAVLNQLLASLSSSAGIGADGLAGLLPSSLPLDSPQLLPALQTLAKYYGLDFPGQPGAASSSSSTPFPAAPDPAPSSAPAPAPAPTSTAAPSAGSGTTRRRSAKDREHFAAIDLRKLAAPPTNKQNPRDANGCSNCKRKKSTIWREGTGSDGALMTVCNACGTFYNKNGYHRNKPGAGAAAAETSPPRQPQQQLAPSSSAAPRAGRPLQGRLTATCEADLQRKVKKHKASAGVVPGVIPPLSPSKHVGPRSPLFKFDFGGGPRSVGRSVGVAMSSPGRSPRLRYRTTVVPYPATSPLRGSTSAATARAAASAKDGAVDYESDGEERGPNPLSFGSLFGLNGSPSPVRIEQRPASGGKGMPSYLLSASPGTALDRILNDTNIGSIGGMACAGGSGAAPISDAMQLEEAAAATLDDDFSFFLQPNSPTRGNKENARPRAGSASATDGAPATDLESHFQSVLSSLRRDLDTRLSSNALTAPSSPAPSSPCVLPRTSTATPGSKGKAPQSGGREPPSILDGFMSSLVPGLVLEPEAGGASAVRQHMGLTPASDSDAWSPADARAAQHDLDHDLDHDQTLTLDSFAGTSATNARPSRSSTQPQQHGEHDKARPSASKNVNRRAPFIPAHLLAPSDATEYDYGSLPPSSPPQLPSEAFPTPSDFDGITPSADGGDNDEQRAHVGAGGAGAGGAESLSLEAVAAHVAREPDTDARKGMIALLQSLGGGGGGAADVSEQVNLAGAGTDQIQLDRGTVNRLLALISAKSPTGEAAADDVSPTPVNEPAPAHPAAAATTSSASSEKRSAATTKATAPPAVSREQAHPAPDLSHFDFEAFATGNGDAPTAAAPQSFGAGGQLSELYADLFSGAPQF